MTAISGKVRPLLATARIANVPSVISNVFAGIVIAAAFQRWAHRGSFWLDAIGLMLAGVLLYIAGNFFNDWHDREWDRKNRPERALPSGLFPPGSYLLLAVAFALGGLLLAACVHPASGGVALLITFFIVIYTRWHKRAIWPVIPMGLCRALLPVMGFVGFSNSLIIEIPGASPHDSHYLVAHPGTPWFLQQPILLAHAVALLIYIAALSLGARYESSANPSKAALGFSKIMLILSGLIAGYFWLTLSVKSALLGLLPFAVWMTFCLTKYRRPIPVHVSALLAGIPFIDWIALLSYALLEPVFHYPPALRPCLFACFLIPPLAFIAGRLLQRLAPAT